MSIADFPPPPTAADVAAYPTSFSAAWERGELHLPVPARTTDAATTGRLDVPLDVVVAEAARLAADKAALLAEQRHQYLDLDPDSAVRLPGSIPACLPAGTQPPGGGQ